MTPLKIARIAAVTSILAALTVLAGVVTGSQLLIVIAALAGVGGGIAAYSAAGARISSDPASAAAGEQTRPAGDGSRVQSDEKRAPKAAREGSVLIATLTNVENGAQRVAGDLQRVLAGIVADERGAIDRAEEQTLVASFSRSDHAGAAVHAAQRMLSNVDAVSRRLGHDLRIAIAVHAGPRGEETLGIAARLQGAVTDAVPVLVSEPVARHLHGRLERVDTVAGEGWEMDVFTFPPAQRRLPGF